MKEVPMKLNLACGAQVVEGWVNVDFALGARLAKIAPMRWANRKFHLTNLEWDQRIVVHDLTKHFPWPDSSVDVVYSSTRLRISPKKRVERFSRSATECLSGTACYVSSFQTCGE
jgi:hypothetical protein